MSGIVITLNEFSRTNERFSNFIVKQREPLHTPHMLPAHGLGFGLQAPWDGKPGTLSHSFADVLYENNFLSRANLG